MRRSTGFYPLTARQLAKSIKLIGLLTMRIGHVLLIRETQPANGNVTLMGVCRRHDYEREVNLTRSFGQG